MSTLRAAIQITDGMSPAIRSMNRALGMVISSFETLQGDLGQPMNMTSIRAARDELARAESSFNQLEQEIRESDQAQHKFNQTMNQGGKAASSLGSSLKSAFVAVGGVYATKKLTEQIDAYTGIQARLAMINDGQQTTDELNDKIMQSANRARGAYLDQANAITKLGINAADAFDNNDEIIRFSELLAKNFKIGGASAQEQTAAMYQLTQAMAAGKLQGDEFRSIQENAPLLAEAIAKQMVVARGELKQLGADGMITSDIIKAAMFNAAAEIEERFAQMPVTFGDVANLIGNQFSDKIQPTYERISKWLNKGGGTQAIDSIATSAVYLADALAVVLISAMDTYNFFASNWGMIGSIVYAVVGALIAYNVALLVGNGVIAGRAAVAGVMAAATMLQEGATIAATVAEHGLNAALLASPITWYVLLVLGLVAAFYAGVGAINKFAGTSLSATGLITGAFMWAFALIGNGIIGVGHLLFGFVEGGTNQMAAFANFFANVFNDPVGSVIHLFGDMADNVLGIIERIAKAIDTVFGSNLAASVSGWRSNLGAMVDSMAATYGNGTYEAKFSGLNMDEVLGEFGLKMGRFDMTDAFDKGYNFGKGIKLPGSGFNGFDLGETNALLEGINETASGIKDSVDIAEDDLRYMRDLAEQEVINRFTTAEIKIEQNNTFGDVRETADLDGIMAYLENDVREGIIIAAEGVDPDV